MPFIYDLKALALPKIKFTNRAAYKLLTGQDAPAPNFADDQKNWVDTAVLASPADYGRRVTYFNVLALDDTGATKWIDATNEPDPTRRAFYAQYNIKLVPTFESLQLATTQVTSVNLGYEVAVGGDPAYLAWTNGPYVPYPVRPLDPGEAFYPSPFDPLQVVVMADYQKQVGPGPNTVNDKMDQVLAGVNAIRTKLGV
jgi:hypothetical protein